MRFAAATVVLAALFLVLPSAQAQQPPPGGYKPTVVTVDHYPYLLSPLPDHHVKVNITVLLDCFLAQSNTPINFTVKNQPSWLYVTDMPGWGTLPLNNYTGYNNLPCDQSTGYITIRAPMTMNFTTFAPAYRAANFTVVVTRGSDVTTGLGYIQPGYFGKLQLVPPQNVVRIGAQDSFATVQFSIRNLGNGETTVTLTTETPSGTHYDAPDVIIVGANPQGGQWDRQFTVKVYLDNFQGSSLSVTVNATGASRNVTDPVRATPASATAVVSITYALPGPAPEAIPTALAVIVAAAALMWYRRS
ncbi:MAG: hypothetical protein ACYDDF_00645 [Thermoplasmatota archaeon]